MNKLYGKESAEFDFERHIENLKEMSVAPAEYPDPEKIYHAVIMVAYNEGVETLTPTIEAVVKNSFRMSE